MNTRPAEFSTRDIFLATILKQSGIPLLKVIDNNGRGIFIFKSSEQIERLINGYFNNELRVDPKSFVENWKSLKSLAYSITNNMG